MDNMNIDKTKVIFITIDWMKYYRGITPDDEPLGTGGSYPKDQKYEIYNFLDDDGTCYGYVTPYGKVNLDRINKSAVKISADGYKYIDNVLVIFNGSNQDGNKRKIIGFYVGATIFDKPYENKNPKRIIQSNNSFANYSIRVKAENAYLLEANERNIILPYSKEKGKGMGYGQNNKWYADTIEVKDEREKIINLIEEIINKTIIEIGKDDELKYLEGKISSSIKNISAIERNAKARKECLKYYFPNGKKYQCQICNFCFEDVYGGIEKNYIEVHHIKSHTTYSLLVGEHEIDPRKGLIPVCSNCHSIIHRDKPPMLIEKKRNNKEWKTKLL
jgi:5-methylcytosine-specific restriction protein A